MVDIFGSVRGLIYRNKDEWLPRPEGMGMVAKACEFLLGGNENKTF